MLLTEPPRPFPTLVRESLRRGGPAAAASLILLPLVLFDIVRLSNRFAAPVQQVRHGLRRLAAGRPVQPVFLRKDDFWQDLAVSFNQCLDQTTAPTGSDKPD
jgi:hypothetical protein